MPKIGVEGDKVDKDKVNKEEYQPTGGNFTSVITSIRSCAWSGLPRITSACGQGGIKTQPEQSRPKKPLSHTAFFMNHLSMA